ncbi:hypothetical protein [Bryobacter aggregatus]|uniref:NHL domain-containing protein n=1 Tax=Bryobacter aggregatus TaxID=360054 RepID=UPI00138E4995|nr:hypothetical protein [Bryobacter aggregatus]
MQIVSSANYQKVVAPESLATLFGTGLSKTSASAQLDANGKLPLALEGVSLTVGGVPARLVYVSPTQVNFVVPSAIQPGEQPVVVTSAALATEFRGSVVIARYAPGLFTLPCLRSDRAAVLDAVHFTLEPFQSFAASYPGTDKRTRLALFGTGFRFAADPAGGEANVASAVSIVASYGEGLSRDLVVEYAGPAPLFAGLDQLNVILPEELQSAGLVRLRATIAGTQSNVVSLIAAAGLLIPTSENPIHFQVATVAGTGSAATTGDGGRASLASLNLPSAVAVDADGNIFIAEVGSHVIRRIDRDGTVSTPYGSGQVGSAGDGGPAKQASFRSPSALAFDRIGNLYVADSEDHRVRVIAKNGIIRAFAGSGIAGDSGFGVLASTAKLSSPVAVTVDRYGAILIADALTHRVVKVSADGMLSLVAGTGVKGYSGDGGSGYLAQLDSPNGIAVAADNAVFVSDSGNRRIRRIEATGTIRTMVGSGLEGDQKTACAPLDAGFGRPSSITFDAAGTLWIADSVTNRIVAMDSTCLVNPIAGSGSAGYSGDGASALEARFHAPAGLATQADGSILIADSLNNRLRKIITNCEGPTALTFTRASNASAAEVTVTLSVGCALQIARDFTLSASLPGLDLPPVLTIPPGADHVSFRFTPGPELAGKLVTLTATSPGGSVSGSVFIPAAEDPEKAVLHVSFPRESLTAGESMTGVVTLRGRDLSQPVTVQLSSDGLPVLLASQVVIPAGEIYATFLVQVPANAAGQVVQVSTRAGTLSASTSFQVLPSSGSSQVTLQSLQITPSSEIGGNPLAGLLTLAAPAGPGGATVTLQSNNGAATPPASVSFAAGESSVAFAIGTKPVSSFAIATITASSLNQVSAMVEIRAGLATGSIQSLVLSPSSVSGGGTSVLTVTLLAPAGSGGVPVYLSTNSGAITIPSALVVPEGSLSASTQVATSAVTASTIATITAVALNTATVQLSIQPGSVTPSLGNLAGISISPATLAGGNAATGTVTLASPAGSGGVLVNLSSSATAATLAPSIVIPAGALSGTFPIATTAVSSAMTVSIAASSSNNVSASLTIQPSGPGTANLAGITLSPTAVASGASSTGTVSLATPATGAGVLVSLSSSSPSATLPASIVIPTGSSSGTFTVSTTAVGSETLATITAASANAQTASLTIHAATAGQGVISGLSLAPVTVASGGSATGTVTLASPAPAGGVLVTLGSNQSAATTPASIVIPAGASTGSFPVTTTPVASTTTVVITANSANAASASLTINAATAGQGTISGISLLPATVASGGSAAGTVSLGSPAPAGGILVTLASDNPAATLPGSLLIPAGASSGTFTVATTAVGATASVTITASSTNSLSAALTINAATAGQGALSGISLAPATVASGGASTATVTLAAPAPTGGILVTLASSNAAATVPGTLVIAAGASSGTFAVSTTAVSTATTLSITATSANSVSASLTINAATAGQGTLSGVSLSPSTVASGASSTGTVSLGSPAPAGGILVTLSSSNPAATVPASLVIPAGSSTGSFAVATTAVGSNTAVTITASSTNSLTANLAINAATAGQGNLSGLSLSPASVASGASANGTVSLAAPAPVGGILVNLSSSNPAATVPASLTIPAGASSSSFTVSTTAVASTTVVSITASSANSISASLTIQAATAGQGALSALSVSPATVASGGSATGTVTLATAAPIGGILVTFASSNPAATVPASLTIAAGSSSGTFPVTTSAVATTTALTITASSANTATAGLTINAATAGQGSIAGVTLSPSTVASAASSTGTVTLATAAPLGGVLVTLTSSNAAATVPPSLTIAAGASSGSFTVTTTAVGSTTTLSITATSANTVSAGLTINAATAGQGNLSGVSLSPATVESGASSTGTVSLASVAPAGGILVTLASSNVAATVPASIIIPAGSSSGNFTVSTTAVGTATNLQITASSANSVQAGLHINAAGPGSVAIGSVSISPASVLGGNGATGTVTLSAPAPTGGAAITLASNNGAAAVSPSLTIAAGQSSGSFAITTTPVGLSTSVSITATSANSTSASLTLTPPCVSSLNLSVSITDLLSGNGLLNGAVSLTGPAPAGGLPIQFVAGSTNIGSATVPAGQTSTTISLSVSNLLSLIGSTLTALTSSPCGGIDVNLQLLNPLVSGLSVSPSSVSGGASSTGIVTLAVAAPSGGVIISLSSNQAVATVPSSITIPAGQLSGSFSITTTNPGSPQTATITAASTGNSKTASLTVNPAGPQLVSLASVSLSMSSLTGGTATTGTVTLTAPAPVGGATVNLQSGNAAATVVGSLTIPAGATSANFAVSTLAVASSANALISATSANTVSQMLNVLAPCLSGLNLSLNSVLGGQGLSGTVTLTGPAPAGGLSVPLLYTGLGVSGPASILVPQGSNTANFSIATSPVGVLLSSVIQGVLNGCAPVSVNLSVNPAILTGLNLSPSVLGLLGTSTGTVTLNGPAPAGGVVVTLSSSLLSSILGVPSSVTIPAGATSASFTVLNLLSSVLQLLNPIVGSISATLGSVSTSAGITLQLL